MPTVKEKQQKVKQDTQAMAEAYARMAATGPQHQLLAKLEGNWVTKSKAWMAPDQPPEESTGSSVNKMMYGGRFLRMEYTDTMEGKPVAGMVILGFDGITKKYICASLGSMSTAIFFYEGPDSPDGKTITQEGHYDDPVMGSMTYRAVTKIVDDNTFTFEMYGIDKGGKETKMLESTYTRKQ